jgi:hypothetical protein
MEDHSCASRNDRAKEHHENESDKHSHGDVAIGHQRAVEDIANVYGEGIQDNNEEQAK